MTRLEDALVRLNSILAPPVGPTNEVKVFEPVEGDANATIKWQMIEEAHRAIGLGNAALGNQPLPTKLIDNEVFFALQGLPETDAEKRDYYELFNAAQEVLVAASKPA